VSDERSNFSVGGAHRNGFVDTTSKMSDTILEVVVRNLHDV
jgi:hypothetical protein